MAYVSAQTGVFFLPYTHAPSCCGPRAPACGRERRTPSPAHRKIQGDRSGEKITYRYNKQTNRTTKHEKKPTGKAVRSPLESARSRAAPFAPSPGPGCSIWAFTKTFTTSSSSQGDLQHMPCNTTVFTYFSRKSQAGQGKLSVWGREIRVG